MTTNSDDVKREQAKDRMQHKRDINTLAGGINLSGPIDKETTKNLDFIVKHLKSVSPNDASRIGATRFAINYAAEGIKELKKQEKNGGKT